MPEMKLVKKKRILERIKQFTLMDDNFMSVFFNDDLERTGFVLQIILNMPDLRVTSAKSQYTVSSLKGRGIRLDVRAEDADGKIYDIEIQQAGKGASAKRARYNSSLMDTDAAVSGMEFEKLPESYVIFITETDVLGANLPLYHIDRMICEVNKPFDDKAHIVYVNGRYRGDSPIGCLLHDFSCSNADDMKNAVLADKVRLLKQTEQGVSQMCRAVQELVDEFVEEGKLEERIENAARLISQGEMTEEKVKAFFSFTDEQMQTVLSLVNKDPDLKK